MKRATLLLHDDALVQSLNKAKTAKQQVIFSLTMQQREYEYLIGKILQHQRNEQRDHLSFPSWIGRSLRPVGGRSEWYKSLTVVRESISLPGSIPMPLKRH